MNLTDWSDHTDGFTRSNPRSHPLTAHQQTSVAPLTKHQHNRIQCVKIPKVAAFILNYSHRETSLSMQTVKRNAIFTDMLV